MIVCLLAAAGAIIGVVVANDNSGSKDGGDSDDPVDPDDPVIDPWKNEAFAYNALIQINGAYSINEDSSTTCNNLEQQIVELGATDWYSVTIAATDMEASAMNYLIRCLANSTNVAENGYTKITFDDWDDLNGELDSDILQQLADASPNAASFSLSNMRSLNSDEQIQLIGFSTMLLDSSSSMASISIKEVS